MEVSSCGYIRNSLQQCMCCNEMTLKCTSCQITFRVVTTNEEEARKYMVLMRRWMEDGQLLSSLADQDLPFDFAAYTREYASYDKLVLKSGIIENV
jgi:hypothetical protein